MEKFKNINLNYEFTIRCTLLFLITLITIILLFGKPIAEASMYYRVYYKQAYDIIYICLLLYYPTIVSVFFISNKYPDHDYGSLPNMARRLLIAYIPFQIMIIIFAYLTHSPGFNIIEPIILMFGSVFWLIIQYLVFYKYLTINIKSEKYPKTSLAIYIFGLILKILTIILLGMFIVFMALQY